MILAQCEMTPISSVSTARLHARLQLLGKTVQPQFVRVKEAILVGIAISWKIVLVKLSHIPPMQPMTWSSQSRVVRIWIATTVTIALQMEVVVSNVLRQELTHSLL
jgi:hypothetical protein